jgi:hypothetical protein
MVENWQGALSLMSLAATAVFGAWPLVLAYQAFRYPACITYVHRAFLPFGFVVRSLPDLSVEVDGQPLSENVVLLQGALVCRGTKDVTASMVVEPLTLRLRAGWRWLAVGKIEASPGLQPQITIEQAPSDSAVVSFGSLFRCDEYIAFTALLQMDPDNPKSSLWSWPLSCDHRITDTRVNELTAPHRSLAPTLRMLVGGLLYAIYIGLVGYVYYHSTLFLEVLLVTSALTFVTSIGAHLWRLRAARALPRHLFPESLF